MVKKSVGIGRWGGVILILAVVVLFVVIFFASDSKVMFSAMPNSNTHTPANNVPSTTTPPPGMQQGAPVVEEADAVGFNCTDSDGGLNYFVKGIVRGLSSSPLGKPITITDYCWKDKFPNSTYGERLREMSCLPDNHIAQEDYECDVCLDGACVE